MPRTKINEKSFAGQSIYIGIDYHLKSWKVTILSEDFELKTMSRDPDPESLVNYLKENYPGATYKAIYESGFSGFHACRKLRSLSVDCHVVHAMDVPSSHKDRQQKCDKSDSRRLAQLLRSKNFESLDVPPVHIEIDRKLLRHHQCLSKALVAEKNRVKAILNQFGIAIPDRFTSGQSKSWSKLYINWLRSVPGIDENLQLILNNYLENGLIIRQQLLKVIKQIRELSQDSKYKEDCKLLTTIPGIGTLGAMRILLQLYDIKRFATMDDLCCYVGLIPKMYGSGEKMVVGKLSKRGRKDIKIMLVEAAWIAMRKDPALTSRFAELTQRMNKNKAIIRIAKNILARIRHLLNHKVAYELGVVK